MATRISKPDLLQRIISATRASGWSTIVLSSGHPFRFSLFLGDQRIIVICYIWNLTHGGYPRDPNELRIQITGVHRFHVQEEEQALLLGLGEDQEMFCGF